MDPYQITHTRSRRESDGAVHTAQMREFFVLMGWLAAPAPIVVPTGTFGTKFAEELHEFETAFDRGDSVGVADGLGDMAYVVIAIMLRHGVAASLEHFSWTGQDRLDRLMAAIPCTAEQSEPCGAECSIAHLHRASALISRIGTNPYAARWYGLRALRGIDALAALTATPMREVFTEVHRSNMTKTRSRLGHPVKGPGYREPVLGPILSAHLDRL